MFVKELSVATFRHIENLHIGPLPQPSLSELVVLAGPNAGGKSSVLELLGYALSNAWGVNWQLARTFPNSSFEVALGINDEELVLVLKHLEKIGGDRKAVAEYLTANKSYPRNFSFPGGRYQENPTLFAEIHNVVSNTLRNEYGRALGFFLKSDRSYPPQAFSRDRLFAYGDIMRRDYIWGMAFTTSDVQYRDMFEFLVQQRYHYFRLLGQHRHRELSGANEGKAPSDPLRPYDELLQKLFPGYRFAEPKEDVPTNLFIELPSGEVVPFGDLSSGEKEVFFVLSFFLRHDVTNAIVVVDEPELHLHPEFARLLTRTMQDVKRGNQLWIATHNPEIIDEAGRERVTYLSRDPKTRKAVAVSGADESEVARQLKNLFGYSGYIGIARSMVFIEGTETSADRKMLAALFPEAARHVKFVPAQGHENLPRINAAVLAILEGGLASMKFYLIRDRDYLTQQMADEYSKSSAGRIHVLERNQIENYLLDDEAIAKVQTELFGKPITAEAVRAALYDIAIARAGEVLRDMVAFRLNLIFRPKDFSLGKFMEGQRLLSDKGEWNPALVSRFEEEVVTRANEVTTELDAKTTTDVLRRLVHDCVGELGAELTTDGWRGKFPGKRLLEDYAKRQGLGTAIVLQNSVIHVLGALPDRVAPELRKVMTLIATGEPLK